MRTALAPSSTSEPATPTSLPFLPPELVPINPGNLSKLELVAELPFTGASVVAFSPNSRRFAAGLFTSNLVKIWDLADGHELHSLDGRFDPRIISYLAFSPDGTQLASAAQGWDASNDSLILWDASSGEELQRFTGMLGALSPYWSLAATTRRESMSGDNLEVRDLTRGELIHRLEAPGEIYRVSFSPKGERVAASMYGVYQNLFSFWFMEDGRHYRTIYDWLGFSFSPDGRFLAAIVKNGSGSNQQGVLNVYGGQDFSWIRTLAKGADSLWYIYPAFSPNGELLAASFDGEVRFWETLGWEEIGSFPTARPTALLFSPDGRLLITHTHSEPVLVLGVIDG